MAKHPRNKYERMLIGKRKGVKRALNSWGSYYNPVVSKDFKIAFEYDRGRRWWSKADMEANINKTAQKSRNTTGFIHHKDWWYAFIDVKAEDTAALREMREEVDALHYKLRVRKRIPGGRKGGGNRYNTKNCLICSQRASLCDHTEKENDEKARTIFQASDAREKLKKAA